MMSILNDIKKVLGLAEDYHAFDLDVIMHINAVFADLHQIGVGPETEFAIQDDTAQWSAFLDTPHLNAVKTYMYLRVRLLFDPPSSSFVLEAMKEQINKMEFRLNVVREGTKWTDPDPPVVE